MKQEKIRSANLTYNKSLAERMEDHSQWRFTFGGGGDIGGMVWVTVHLNNSGDVDWKYFGEFQIRRNAQKKKTLCVKKTKGIQILENEKPKYIIYKNVFLEALDQYSSQVLLLDFNTFISHINEMTTRFIEVSGQETLDAVYTLNHLSFNHLDSITCSLYKHFIKRKQYKYEQS